MLLDGNARFRASTPHYPHHNTSRRELLCGGQEPFAAIFGCSDSRVPPELIFDRGLGDLFVIRTAGHAVGPTPLGTIEYGVAHLHTSILAVVGHEACGAVGATIATHDSGERPPGHIAELTDRLASSISSARDQGHTDTMAIVNEHVRCTIRQLCMESDVVGNAVEAGDLAVVGLSYTLNEGAIELVDWIGELGIPRVA